MSIKSGQRYKITNEQAQLVVDLSGADSKSIIGWTSHGGENQQWITEEQYDGQWTIRSVALQKYIALANTPKDGTALVALDEPQLWDIKIVDNGNYAKTSVKFCIRNTTLVADFPLDKLVVGTGIQLWADWNGKNQIWVLEERESRFDEVWRLSQLTQLC
ncbi:ricin B lectin domain-containing protein [Lactarius quietus]|nr:ricin B lectin domain-containing protein [Lactarius quietus]